VKKSSLLGRKRNKDEELKKGGNANPGLGGTVKGLGPGYRKRNPPLGALERMKRRGFFTHGRGKVVCIPFVTSRDKT